MTVPRILLVLAAVALGLGAGWLFVAGEEPDDAAGPGEAAVAPAPIEVTVPVTEPAEARPSRHVGPFAPLPPDPIADRIAAGEELFTLHGEVLDSVSGNPVKIYRSFLEAVGDTKSDPSSTIHLGRTWANPIGTFTYRGLYAGTYDLLIKVQGYQDLRVASVVLPMTEEKLSLTLSRGAYIDVTVNDFEGDGIGQLEVRLNPIQLDDPENGPRIRLRHTDDHGKALFTDLPSGTYTVAMANAALSEYASQAFYLGHGQAYPLTFTVPPLNTVMVQANDQKGNALNLVQVRMWSKEGKGVFRTETDSDGQAKIEHVPSGEYTVKLYKHGCRRKTQALTVESRSGDVELAIALIHDPAAQKAEENPTAEQMKKLKAGLRPHEVFTGKDG